MITAALARFSSLPPKTRILLVAAVAVVFVCAVAGSFATRDTRVALYPYPLLADQVDEVDRTLSQWNVLHVATSDGVRVDAKRRDDLRARLAVLGIPHRHLASSSETLAKVGALTPQSVLESQQLAGLEADIALGLRSFAGVEDARVTIAPAKSGVYADEKSSDTTAAVTLRLAPHAHPSGTTMRRYVAASVPGLDPAHVALVDDRGSELKDDGGAPAGEELQASLQSELDRVLGENNAIVAVTVVRDARNREIRDVRRTPLGPGAIAATHSEEKYASDRKHYTKSNATEDRGSDVREERIQSPAGTPQRLSVAVTVDASHQAEISKIRAIAEATIGFDRERGDQVKVVAIPFSRNAVAAAPAGRSWPWLGSVLALIPSLVTGIAIVVVLALVGRPAFAIVARSIDRTSLKDVAANACSVAPVQVRAALAGEPPHTAAAVISALPTASAAAVLELYPPDERAAIVRRLSRQPSALLPSYEELLRDRLA